jgi:hypothetical protein
MPYALLRGTRRTDIGQMPHETLGLLGLELDVARLGAWPPDQVRSPHAPVAQLDRALPSEGRGHTFESCRVRHYSYRSFVYITYRNGDKASD